MARVREFRPKKLHGCYRGNKMGISGLHVARRRAIYRAILTQDTKPTRSHGIQQMGHDLGYGGGTTTVRYCNRKQKSVRRYLRSIAQNPTPSATRECGAIDCRAPHAHKAEMPTPRMCLKIQQSRAQLGLRLPRIALFRRGTPDRQPRNRWYEQTVKLPSSIDNTSVFIVKYIH